MGDPGVVGMEREEKGLVSKFIEARLFYSTLMTIWEKRSLSKSVDKSGG
jgi:hypothetical protein